MGNNGFVKTGNEGQKNRFLYEGKEWQAELGLNLYDFYARQFDRALGRFLAVDAASQFSSPYLDMGNMPVMTVDPDGNIAFLALGATILKGALVGAVTSAAINTGVSLATVNWDNFGTSVLYGAIGGAIGGGLTGVFAKSAFAQTTAFNVISNTVSNTVGSTIMGNELNFGNLVGSVAGGIVGSKIPGFRGVDGGDLANIGAEIGYKALKFGVTGAVSGGVGAYVNREDVLQGALDGAITGAVGGAALGTFNVLTMGATYIPEDYENLIDEYGKSNLSAFRKGTFLTRLFAGSGSGVALGRNLVTNLDEKDFRYFSRTMDAEQSNRWLQAHELEHYNQQIRMGFGTFYTRTLHEYLTSGYGSAGSLEDLADKFATGKVGSRFLEKK